MRLIDGDRLASDLREAAEIIPGDMRRAWLIVAAALEDGEYDSALQEATA